LQKISTSAVCKESNVSLTAPPRIAFPARVAHKSGPHNVSDLDVLDAQSNASDLAENQSRNHEWVRAAPRRMHGRACFADERQAENLSIP
jgi:hypothetical protein